MTKRKILFIVNPISGGTGKVHLPSIIDENIDKEKFDPVIRIWEKNTTALEMAQKAIEENFDIVVAAGGDGTINQVGRGLMHSNVALGVIPLGSGNGLARHLNIPLKAAEAVQHINKLQIQTIDAIRVNDEFSFNVSGIGFDAHVAHLFAKLPSRGLFGYARTSLVEFAKYRPHSYEMIIDGQKTERKAFLISFANSSQWGNDFYISPLSVVNDGFLDISIIPDITIANMPMIAYHLRNKTLHKTQFAEIIKARKVSLQLPANTPIHVDGEPVTISGLLEFEIIPASLKMIV